MTERSEFRQGVSDILPMTVAYAPIATLWGTIAAAHGLSPLEALLMSLFVYSGAAQFVAMDLGATGISLWFLVFTIVTVSLRHVLMSASLSRHITGFRRSPASVLLFWMTDEAWALIERRALNLPITPAYFFGVAFPIWPTWFLFSGFGAWLGKALGDTKIYGLDFAFAAMFIAVLAGFWKGSKTAAVLIASAAAAVAAKHFLPGAWYILAGGIAGMIVAVVAYRESEDV